MDTSTKPNARVTRLGDTRTIRIGKTVVVIKGNVKALIKEDGNYVYLAIEKNK
jgi:hypothetical protein